MMRDRRERRDRAGARRPDRGTVLIVTMWIVLVLAGLVLVFAHAMRVEAIAAANRRAGFQADAVARGALEFVRAALDAAGGDTEALADVECDMRYVGEGAFWLLHPNLSDDDDHAFAVVEEAARIDLNSASSDMLLKLPGMTAELADAIVDWRDDNADVSPSGAEDEYYLLLSEPYYCKDSPLETVEEILLLRGAAADLIYGEDTNRNGVLDVNENDADTSAPADNRNGTLDGGFLDYVTVYSAEPNVSADGEQRVNVNDRDTAPLQKALGDAVPEDRIYTILSNARMGKPYENILDFYFRSGLKMEEFAAVADRLTTTDDEEVRGLVNVGTAPREVLLCLPELDESDVDALLSRRGDSDTALGGIAWVAEALDREKAVAIGGHITARSYQFSADIVAVSGDGRAYRRCRAVLDTRKDPPRVLRWQDLTHLGWPLDPAILAALRENGRDASTSFRASY